MQMKQKMTADLDYEGEKIAALIMLTKPFLIVSSPHKLSDSCKSRRWQGEKDWKLRLAPSAECQIKSKEKTISHTGFLYDYVIGGVCMVWEWATQ